MLSQTHNYYGANQMFKSYRHRARVWVTITTTTHLNKFLVPRGWYTRANTEHEWHRRIHRDDGTKESPPPPIDRERLQGYKHSLHWFGKDIGFDLMFKLDHGGDGDNVAFSLAIPFILRLYMSWEYCYPMWIERITGKYGSRQWEISIHRTYGIHLRWNQSDTTMGDKEHGWGWWWQWNQLKGRQNCEVTVLETKQIEFEQPASHGYPATKHVMELKLQRWYWTWGNWFVKPHERVSWDINVQNPPNFAGKGENSWDCGKDGTWSMSAPGHFTPTLAVVHYITHVVNMRTTRG